MLAILGSGAFQPVQVIDWNVQWFDSSMTVPERGVGIRLGTPTSSFTTNGMQTAASAVSYFNSNTTPVLTNSGTWGNTSAVVEFWGTGSPAGITKARYVAMHWRGFLGASRSWAHPYGTTNNFWLAFAGNGWIRVLVNGTTVLNTKLSYSSFTASTLINSPNVNDQIDIFYWQLGEPWGGLAGSYVVQQQGQTSATSNITNSQYREAPAICSSLIPFSISSGTTLQQVIDANVEISGMGETSTLTFRIPLSNQDISSGWRLLTNPRRLQFTDPASGLVSTLKRRQLIKFTGGFQSEQYNRFTGNILDFEEQDGIVSVKCSAIEDRMAKIPIKNYPDPISYCTFGYFKQISTAEPIFGITAYDNWPLEHAIKDLCLRSGIDPSLHNGIKKTNVLSNSNYVIDISDGPNTIGGLKGWYAADKIANVTSGTAISVWPDLSGEGHDLIQSGAAAQPKWIPNQINLMPIVQFDGFNDSMRTGAWTQYFAPVTFISVITRRGPDPAGNVTFMDAAAGGGSLQNWEKSSLRYSVFHSQGYSDSNFASDVWRTLICQYGSPGFLENNGVRTIGNTDPIAYLNQLTVGNGYNGATAMQCDIAEIMIYNRALTQTELNKIKAYINTKYFTSRNNWLTDIQDEFNNKHYSTRAKSISGGLLKLQRPALYGNAGAGFDVTKPNDDEYIYKPNLSRSTLDWARELADTLGYEFRSNVDGQIILTSKNNPDRFTNAITAGSVTKFSPTAVGGKYYEYTSGFTFSTSLNGARFDLCVGREQNQGTINYTVNIMSGAQVAAGSINLALAGEINGVFYYDNRYTVSGNNIALFPLFSGPWGKYTITITNGAGSKWWLDSVLSYDRDATMTLLPQSLVTDFGISDLRTQTNAQEAINRVVVIGKRKATLTDSEKARNPNNPEDEFYVSSAADPSAIWDPTASNYTGGEVASFIIDDKISDQDYADWAAITLLTRQRDPGPSAEVTHTILPFLEPRDVISVGDQNYTSITASTDLWITKITENYEASKSDSRISTTAYAQIPSYDPRQDLDIATIDSTFFGQPIINFGVTYPSIDSGTVTNPSANLTDARLWGYSGAGGRSYLLKENRVSTYGSDANGSFINMSGTVAWPPVPDSIALGIDHPELFQLFKNTENNVYRNHPYAKFWHIFDYSTKKIHLPMQAGDGTAPYQLSSSFWNIATRAQIAYLGLDSTLTPTTVYSGRAPFFDPYITELPDGNFVNITFDALVSGYYRISIWDARNRNSPTLIAWLTEPSREVTNANLHWSYLQAGRGKSFLWDGVDTLGEWNAKQSETYSWTARGWFEKDQKPEIGKGFYVWNDVTSEVVTISGQTLGNKLTFNPDHYSQFYIKVECMNDAFAVDAEQGSTYGTVKSIRTVDSSNLQGVSAGQNPVPSIYIYTHLPPPTKIKITGIEDWSPSTKTYDEINDPYAATSGWITISSGIGDAAGTFRDDKPIRFTYQAIARPGGRFSGNNQFTTFKVHRVAHLNANYLDQFFMFEGEPWHSLTPIEKKRLVSRRLTNATHTVEFADTDYRTGDTLSLAANKWVFRPKDFQIDVNGQKQSLQFCNYLQLEDVPGYSQVRSLGEPKSRLLLAYINYIFYLSTYTQDRSGRMVWAIDPTDIDRTKIIPSTFNIDYPEDLDNYSVRTIVARQWNDPNYVNTMSTQWNIASGTNAYNYIQFFHNRLGRTDNNAAGNLRLDTNGNIIPGSLTTGFTDPYSNFHKTTTVDFFKLLGTYLTNRQLGDWSAGTLTNFFGDWTWEGDATGTSEDLLWIPDLTRDFHPYVMCPPMPQEYQSSIILNKNFYGLVAHDNTNYNKLLDQSAHDLWFSTTYPITNTGNWKNTNLFGVVAGVRSHRSFNSGHSAEETLQQQQAPDKDLMNYQRQNELLHWEDFRGFISTGPYPARATILVQPGGGAYMQNLYAYKSSLRDCRAQFNTDGSHIVGFLEVEYQNEVMNPETDPKDGFFEWTFRSKYNWYSSSYFPVNDYGKIEPKFLYPKYSLSNFGTPTAYDAGAWVGWKDDLTAGTGLVWQDWASKNRFTLRVNVGSSNNNNPYQNPPSSASNILVNGNSGAGTGLFGSVIPGSEIDRMPYAISGRFNMSKDVLISLALVNSRRLKPIAGKN